MAARSTEGESVAAVGARLRLIRLAFGVLQGYPGEMSQAEIARLAEINRQSWNNTETGDALLGLANAKALCRLTGVSLDYLFFGNRAHLPHLLAVEIARIEKQETKHVA